MKQTRLLFIDRDGTLIQEPEDEQIDSFEKLVFTKGVFRNLAFIAQHTDYELVMVSNQDGLGTDSFPEDTFWPVHNFIIQTLESEGIHFAKQHIDRHFPEDNSPMRKPGTGMLTEYIDNPAYDMANSYVIGDRETDAQLAENLGCKSLILGKDGMDWDKIAEILFAGDRIAEVKRTTKETDIYIKVNLDGSGKCDISTGLGFFDHMLEQIGKHGMMDLTIHTKGDLYVDEHHTIEDTGIALGECLLQALGDKRGIERYGYSLPMDDCLCQVVYGFGVIKKFHSAVGYRGLKAVDLLKDVLDDNKELNAEQVLTEAYPQIYSRGTFLPIYKYLSLIGIESDESYKRNKLGLNYPLRKKEDFQSYKYLDEDKNLSLQEAIEKYNSTRIWKAIALIPYLYISKDELPTLCSFIEHNFYDFLIKKNSYSTFMRKLICYYDWLKYGWE